MTGKQPSYDHPIEEGQFFSDGNLYIHCFKSKYIRICSETKIPNILNYLERRIFFEYVKFINITIIIFIEPGYYEDGSFGMRVESIMEVKKFNLKVIL